MTGAAMGQKPLHREEKTRIPSRDVPLQSTTDDRNQQGIQP